MANSVLNRLTALNAPDSFFEYIKSNESTKLIDFNKIIPMASSLRVNLSSSITECLSAVLSALSPETPYMGVDKLDSSSFVEEVSKISKHYSIFTDMSSADVNKIATGKIYLDNLLNYNSAWWYDWRLRNWGTCCNAFDTLRSDDAISFYTQWTPPLAVIKELSHKFPEVTLILEWADEDLGFNVGTVEYSNGNSTDNTFKSGTKEAYEFAAELWQLDLAEEGYVFDQTHNTYDYVGRGNS